MIFPKQTEGRGERIRCGRDRDQYGTGVKKVQVSKTAGELIPTKPVVTHEIPDSTEVYPDFQSRLKYTGPLTRNFGYRFHRAKGECCARRTGFFRCSGALAAACWERDQATIHSQYIAGFQLLDLQDFCSGQEQRCWECWTHSLGLTGLISRIFCSDCAAGTVRLCADYRRNVRGKVSMRTVLPQSGTAEWMLVRGKRRHPGQGRPGTTESV